MQRVGAREELDAGHVRHPLVGDEQGDRLGGVRQGREPRQAGGGRSGAEDPGVVAEAPVQIGLERAPDGRLRGDDEHDGKGRDGWFGAHRSRFCSWHDRSY